MFSCEIYVDLPLRLPGEQKMQSFVVARYNFDPGLRPGDTVHLNDVSFISRTINGRPAPPRGPKFTFAAQVLSRESRIEPGVEEDDFVLSIQLEIADKEQIPEITRLLKEKFPESFEDYSSPLTEEPS
jgi:hypothetical protein